MFQCATSREDHPDWSDFQSVFSCFLCRSSDCPKSPATYESQYNAYISCFREIREEPLKVTHYGRQECYVQCDESGVHPEQVDRLCNRIHDAKHSSYALNLPRDALVARAGGDPNSHGSYYAAHFAPMSNVLVELLLPWLRAEKDKLKVALEEALDKGRGEKKKSVFMLFKVLLKPSILWWLLLLQWPQLALGTRTTIS